MANYDLTKVLPHNPPMLLLDDVLEYDLESRTLIALFKVFEGKLFYDKGIKGINSLVGIEIMAQAIGCYSFFKAGQNKSQMGLLLGSRLFNNSIDRFENGKKYTIAVHEIFTDNQIASFDCIIKDEDGNEIQSAGLNVCHIASLEDFLNNENE